MSKKRIKTTPKELLYHIAESQQGLFTARQAILVGYNERNHPYHVKSGAFSAIFTINRKYFLKRKKGGFVECVIIETQKNNRKQNN